MRPEADPPGAGGVSLALSAGQDVRAASGGAAVPAVPAVPAGPEAVWFAAPPALPFLPRVVTMIGLLLLGVWAEDIRLLLAGAAGCVLFRRLCCPDLAGLGREIQGAAGFALLVGLMAVPAGQADVAALGGRTFLRILLFLSPAASFSRCLYPREGMHALRGWVPAPFLLSLEVALRFLPLLAREGAEVLMIQRCRGAFARGPLASRLHALLFPFFARLFGMADRVTFALRARGVDPARPRAMVPPEDVRQILSTLRSERQCPS